MNERTRDLDRITALLGQCLGRIDEHAFRVQQLDIADAAFLTAEEIDHETAELQELVGTLLDNAVVTGEADLDQIVTRAVQSCLAAIGMPVVVRQRLAAGPARIACAPGELTFAVQRALAIGLGRLDPGEELVLTTRHEDETAVLELECRGTGRDDHLQERALTLCEFVAELGGRCRIESDDQGTLLLALELPQALATDDS